MDSIGGNKLLSTRQYEQFVVQFHSWLVSLLVSFQLCKNGSLILIVPVFSPIRHTGVIVRVWLMVALSLTLLRNVVAWSAVLDSVSISSTHLVRCCVWATSRHRRRVQSDQSSNNSPYGERDHPVRSESNYDWLLVGIRVTVVMPIGPVYPARVCISVASIVESMPHLNLPGNSLQPWSWHAPMDQSWHHPSRWKIRSSSDDSPHARHWNDDLKGSQSRPDTTHKKKKKKQHKAGERK